MEYCNIAEPIYTLEKVAPAVVAAQEQFNFTHIIAGGDAFGKVSFVDYFCVVNSHGSVTASKLFNAFSSGCYSSRRSVTQYSAYQRRD